MGNNPAFADEIFGFHAQQAVEKTLKAWIASLGCDFPLTHNIVALLTVLEEQQVNIESFWELAKFNSFAVQFRYEPYSELDIELERDKIIQQVQNLIEHVKAVLKLS